MKHINLNNLIIAHRGMFNNKTVPENSLAAFQRAIYYQQPIEFDIQLTKDNVLVVFHDYNLKRMTGHDLFVKDVTLAELKTFSLLATEEKIPTLEEVLSIVGGKVLIDIEIKEKEQGDAAVRQLLSLLEDYHGNVVLKSFYPQLVWKLRQKKAPYPIGLLLSDTFQHKIIYSILTQPFIIKLLQLNFLAISKELVKKRKWQKFRKHYPLWVWTIQNGTELHQYQGLADSFICNHLPYPKL